MTKYKLYFMLHYMWSNWKSIGHNLLIIKPIIVLYAYHLIPGVAGRIERYHIFIQYCWRCWELHPLCSTRMHFFDFYFHKHRWWMHIIDSWCCGRKSTVLHMTSGIMLLCLPTNFYKVHGKKCKTNSNAN